MATAAISLLSRPSMAPPTSALPPLPTSKARRNMAPQATAMPQNPLPSPTSLPQRSPLDETAAATGSAPALLHRPAPSLTLSSSQLTAHSTRSSPTERGPGGTATPHHGRLVTGNVSGPPASSDRDASPSALAAPLPPPPGKDIRRTVSVAAFPHPPTRKSSLPVSPLSAGSIYLPATQGLRKAAMDGLAPSPPPALAAKDAPISRLKRSRGAVGSNANLAGSIITSGIPQPSSTSNTANSSPDGNVNSANLVNYGARSGNKPVSAASTAARGSDNLSSVQSPSLSRCSSAQGSDSTAPTTFEDSGDPQPRGREPEDELVVGQPRRQSKQSDGKGNVIVSVRVRPDAHGEHNKADGDWKVDGARSTITYRGREGGDYLYDHVFTPNDRNHKVYDACAKRLVRRVMEGYHGTVFAYGMTGTGKTFSMQGTASSPGVIPLAITDIFSYIRETPHREFLLRVSYLEIYNEKIHDLLSVPVASSGAGMPGGAMQQEEIKLREDSKRGVYATPLKEEIVQSPTQLLRVIARGDLARRTSSTQFNARSSRSHAVVQIVVESRERITGTGLGRDGKRSTGAPPSGVRVSTLSLIDLAGSERAAESKERRQEGAHINKSLLTLGTVIARLSGGKDKAGKPMDKDGRHLPYRDSKLTRLLQPALSGNSLISILCTIQVGSSGSSAAPGSHVAETVNTLKFAARARNNIVSHAKRAEEAFGAGGGDAASRALLERYRMEIQELRSQLENQAKEKRDEEEKYREKEVAQRHEEQMLEMQLARTALKERIEHLNRLILCSKSTGVNASGANFLPMGLYQSTLSRANQHEQPFLSTSARSSSTRSMVGAGSESALARTVSMGSNSAHVMAGGAGGSPPTPLPLMLGNGHGDAAPVDDDDSTGEYGDGMASLAAQVRALQADLADKNRYIATLEKRLLQARRSSHSRVSLAFSPTHRLLENEGDVAALVAEKDTEIADLRARLDDKDHMITALRSAARKRDVADTATDRPLPAAVMPDRGEAVRQW